jgi:hypothetical protein
MSYKCSRLWNFITTSLSNPLLHILQKKKIATKIAAKIARANGPLSLFPINPKLSQNWRNRTVHAVIIHKYTDWYIFCTVHAYAIPDQCHNKIPALLYLGFCTTNLYFFLFLFLFSTLGDLADVLQQVVRLNDEIRPHLERYQELLRSGTDREVNSIFFWGNQSRLGILCGKVYAAVFIFVIVYHSCVGLGDIKKSSHDYCQGNYHDIR